MTSNSQIRSPDKEIAAIVDFPHAVTEDLAVIDLRIPALIETVRDRLSQKLSDRRIHEAQLLQSYHRLKERTKPEFVLISGPSGSGKTHLAKTLRHAVHKDGGMFLLGKFDQLQRPEPYRAFVTAFTEFATIIDHEGQEKLSTLQRSILEAVGAGAGALTDMIPALERVIGHQDRTSSLKNGAEAMTHFVLVFRMFVRAVCSLDNPLVFVLDDMQWADPCSLDLLISLVTDMDSRGVLFVGTCEDNVAMDSLLSSMLRRLEDEGIVQITNVVANNLSNEEVKQIIEDAFFRMPKVMCTDLADVIYNQTEGNICYIIEFFRWLLEEKLLKFNQDRMRWEWEQKAISLSIKHNSVGDFMVDKLEQLPGNVKELLKIASCLGSFVNENLLSLVVDFDLTAALEVSMERGKLVFDRRHRTYAFTHDVAQKAAYRLIKEEDRSRFHLSIGRKLWQRMGERELNQHVFTIVSQYCFSGNLIEDKDEKVAIAGLCLHAGRKAAKASTFRTACIYLNFGIKLLGTSGWKEHYDLALDLHNAAAEMELCTANFVAMNQLLDAVVNNVRNPRDKRQASATRIYALGVRDQQQLALQEGKKALRELGEKFPNRFLKARLLAEAIIIKRLLRGKSDTMLMRLPIMEDSNMLAAVQILDLMFLSSLITQPTFFPFVALKMMKITLKYGSSAWAATACSSYGMVCCAIGDFDQGFRFGRLALAYLEKFQCREFLPRVYFGVYGCIHGWKRPVSEVLEPLRYAHRVGLETGDFEFSFLNSHLWCLSSVQAGLPLRQVEKDVKGFCDLMATKRHESTLQLALAFLQTIQHLMGQTDDPLALAGDAFDYGKAFEHASSTDNSTFMMAILSQRSFLAYIFGEYDLSNELVTKWRNFRYHSGPDMFVACLMDGLIAAAAARLHKNQRRMQLRILRKKIKSFHNWARGSPVNCLDKLFLLEAEQASIRGDHELAYQKYICANALALDSKCLWVQAFANERAGNHLESRNEGALALPFYRHACDLFEEWGAHAKVKRLKASLITESDVSLDVSAHTRGRSDVVIGK